MAERIEIQVVARGIGRTRREIEGIGRSATGSVRGLRQLQLAISALGVGFAAREFVSLSDTVVRLDNRLNLLTGSQLATNGLFRQLEQVARDTRGSLSDTVDLFSRLGRSTQDLGLSQQELLDLTTGVNQAFRIYGNTAAEAEAATIQFSQGLAAGALRGDELRSVLEQAPRLAQAIADGISETEALGPGIRVAIGDLRNLGLQGQLTAEIVSTALQSQLGDLRDEFEQTEITISEAFQQLGNEILSVFRDVDAESDFTQNIAQSILDLRDVIRPAVTFVREFIGQFVALADFLQGTFSAVLGDTITSVIALTAALGVALAVLNVNPLIALATTAIALNAAFATLRESTTQLTDDYFALSSAIQANSGELDNLITLLDEDRITTIQTADAKIQEAIARRENIRVLQEENLEKRRQLEIENEALRAQGRELAAGNELPIFNTGISLFNPFARGQIEELRGQVINSNEAIAQSFRDFETLQADAVRNEEALIRLQALRSSGTLDDIEASRRLNEARTAAQRALDQLTRQAITQGRNAGEAVNALARDIGRIAIEAGTGEQALDDLASAQEALTREADNIEDLISRYRIGGVAEETLQPLITALEEIRELEDGLDARVLEAQSQAIDDIIASLGEERNELRLTNDEQEVRNQLKSIGLNIDNASPEQLAQLRSEVQLIREGNEARAAQEELDRRRLEIIGQLGQRDELARLAEEAQILEEALSSGNLGADQARDAVNSLEEVRQKMEEIRLIANSGDFTAGFLESITQFGLSGSEAMREFGGALGDVTAELSGGFADAIANAIVEGEDLGEALKEVARDAIAQLISSLINLGIQFLVNQAIALATQNAATGAAVAQGSAIAAAFAPAAALVSLATSGANAIGASAGIAATTAVAQGVALLGLRDGGIVAGPGGPRDDAVPAMLSNGEFVVNAAATRDNRALLEAINATGNSGGGRRVTNNVNLNLPGVTDADSFRASERQIDKSLQRRLSR